MVKLSEPLTIKVSVSIYHLLCLLPAFLFFALVAFLGSCLLPPLLHLSLSIKLLEQALGMLQCCLLTSLLGLARQRKI